MKDRHLKNGHPAVVNPAQGRNNHVDSDDTLDFDLESEGSNPDIRNLQGNQIPRMSDQFV